jgi:hypothetical protein
MKQILLLLDKINIILHLYVKVSKCNYNTVQQVFYGKLQVRYVCSSLELLPSFRIKQIFSYKFLHSCMLSIHKCSMNNI